MRVCVHAVCVVCVSVCMYVYVSLCARVYLYTHVCVLCLCVYYVCIHRRVCTMPSNKANGKSMTSLLMSILHLMTLYGAYIRELTT